jgi:hypothetical protein
MLQFEIWQTRKTNSDKSRALRLRLITVIAAAKKETVCYLDVSSPT